MFSPRWLSYSISLGLNIVGNVCENVGTQVNRVYNNGLVFLGFLMQNSNTLTLKKNISSWFWYKENALQYCFLLQTSRMYTLLLRHMSALTPLCIKLLHVLSAISTATLKDLITTSSFNTGGQVEEQINELTTWEQYEPCREVQRVSNTCCWATTTPGMLCICPGLPWSIYSFASEYRHGKTKQNKKTVNIYFQCQSYRAAS